MIYSAILIVLLSSCIASFIMCMIDRLAMDTKIDVLGRSKCDNCDTILPYYTLIPILSYIYYRGKSSCCKHTISRYYIISELIYPLFTILYIHHYGLSTSLILPLIWLYMMLAIALYDAKYMLIDRRITIPTMLLCIIMKPFIAHIIAGIILYIVFYMLAYYKNERYMGYGDSDIMMIIGLYFGIYMSLWTLFIACIMGSIYGIVYCIYHKKYMSLRVPFALFLCISAVISNIYGMYLWDIYKNWIM